MTAPIIESPFEPPRPSTRWTRLLGAAAAGHLQQWQAQRVERLLADVFGYHAVQIGQTESDWLQANRMPHRWRVRAECDRAPAFDPGSALGSGHDLEMDTRAWPWSAASLDLVVLPHTLEWCADAHLCLREVERVLMPGGRVLIAGLQPWRWWSRKAQRHPEGREGLQPIALGRLRDWLRLLDFEVEALSLGGWDTHAAQPGAIRRPLAQLQHLILELKAGLGPVWGKTAFIAMTEFGRTPFFTATEFQQMGYAMVIWPVSHLRIAAKAMEDLYGAIKSDGGTHNMVGRMQTRAALYETIGYHAYESLDASLVRTIVPEGMPQN